MKSSAAILPVRIEQRIFRNRPEDVLPIKIRHQRIYILPTRRGVAFLLCLLLMLLASINYALSLGYALAFLLTGLFAASLLHTYRNVAGIGFKSIKSNSVFAEEHAQYTIVVENNSALARNGISVRTKNANTTFNVAPHDSTAIQLTPVTKHRGYHQLGRLTITSTYPLGLWRTWCYLHTNQESLVYAKPEQSPPAIKSAAQNSDGDNPQKANQGEIAGVRDYQAGDPPSSIAWKAAARGQGLYVKTFEEETQGSDAQLSLTAAGVHELEHQISRLTAWAVQAESAGTDYSLTLPDKHIDFGRGATQLHDVLKALALYRAAP